MWPKFWIWVHTVDSVYLSDRIYKGLVGYDLILGWQKVDPIPADDQKIIYVMVKNSLA